MSQLNERFNEGFRDVAEVVNKEGRIFGEHQARPHWGPGECRGISQRGSIQAAPAGLRWEMARLAGTPARRPGLAGGLHLLLPSS